MTVYCIAGRVHHALNNHQKAVEYLRQGLAIAEQLGRMEDEAKIRHRLGLALWGHGDLEACQAQLYKAAELFESIRRDAQFNSEYQLSLFDLQTACYQALQVTSYAIFRIYSQLSISRTRITRILQNWKRLSNIILIAFSNHNLALETFLQVQITRSAN